MFSTEFAFGTKPVIVGYYIPDVPFVMQNLIGVVQSAYQEYEAFGQ